MISSEYISEQFFNINIDSQSEIHPALKSWVTQVSDFLSQFFELDYITHNFKFISKRAIAIIKSQNCGI